MRNNRCDPKSAMTRTMQARSARSSPSNPHRQDEPSHASTRLETADVHHSQAPPVAAPSVTSKVSLNQCTGDTHAGHHASPHARVAPPASAPINAWQARQCHSSSIRTRTGGGNCIEEPVGERLGANAKDGPLGLDSAGTPPLGWGDGPQARLKTSVPLVPPKPKLFLTATSIFMLRAVLAQ